MSCYDKPTKKGEKIMMEFYFLCHDAEMMIIIILLGIIADKLSK